MCPSVDKQDDSCKDGRVVQKTELWVRRNDQGARLRTLRPERLDLLYDKYFEKQGTDENFEEEVIGLCQRTRKEDGTKVKGFYRLLKLVIKEILKHN